MDSSWVRPPSWHLLGLGDIPLEAKRCRERAIAILIVAVGGLVSAGAGHQGAQPQ
jgi:hypothetical protein